MNVFQDRVGVAQGLLLTHLEETDNARTGASCVAEYEGNEQECRNYKLYLQNLGACDVVVRAKGNGYWVCQGLFPFGFNGQVTDFSQVPSVHELDVCVQQTSIYRSPIVRASMTGQQIGDVHMVIQDYLRGAYPKADGTTAEADATAKGGATGLKLFQQVAYLGLDDFIEYYAVYRRTLTAATPQQVRASWEGIGQIWTTAEVQHWEGILANGWFQLDPNMQWLKSRPQVIAASASKTQVVYTYTEHLIASSLGYTAYGSAQLL
jgi:hypothetical protein